MPWVVKVRGRVVAYVDAVDRRIVIHGRIAPAIEPCLAAYGITVELAVEDETPVLKGIRATIPKGSGWSDERVCRAIMICIGYVFGLRAEAEQLSKLYELVKREEAHETEEKPKEIEIEV